MLKSKGRKEEEFDEGWSIRYKVWEKQGKGFVIL